MRLKKKLGQQTVRMTQRFLSSTTYIDQPTLCIHVIRAPPILIIYSRTIHSKLVFFGVHICRWTTRSRFEKQKAIYIRKSIFRNWSLVIHVMRNWITSLGLRTSSTGCIGIPISFDTVTMTPRVKLHGVMSTPSVGRR